MHIAGAHKTKNDRSRIWMNIAAHQKLNNDKNARKKDTAKQNKKRQTADRRESACCPFALIHWAVLRKI